MNKNLQPIPQDVYEYFLRNIADTLPTKYHGTMDTGTHFYELNATIYYEWTTHREDWGEESDIKCVDGYAELRAWELISEDEQREMKYEPFDISKLVDYL